MLLVLAILTVGMIKEWISDHKRSVADKETNMKLHRRVVRVATVVKNEDPLSEARRRGSLKIKVSDENNEIQTFMYHSEEVKCMDIKVGDLLVLKDNMIVPADCVLVKAPCNNGEC